MKGINGAGLTSVATSDGVYISYLSQGKDPLSHVGVMDMVDGETMDVSVFTQWVLAILKVILNFPFLNTHEIHLICRDFQTDPSTIRASWDVSGDPCPPVKYEWAIRRLDGHEISSFFSTNSKYCKNYLQIKGERVNSSNFCCYSFLPLCLKFLEVV